MLVEYTTYCWWTRVVVVVVVLTDLLAVVIYIYILQSRLLDPEFTIYFRLARERERELVLL